MLLGVQQALEEAIARFSGETVVTQAAGRTDAGVHALGQVVHFDLAREWDANRIREALNFHLKFLQPGGGARLPSKCRKASRPASPALGRHYEYRILSNT